MKIGIYSPYLDSLSGGERYMLTIASCLSLDHGVTVFWKTSNINTDAKRRLNIDLNNVCFDDAGRIKDIIKRAGVLSSFDAFFYLSDGSVPLLFSRNNILHFQRPFLDFKPGLKDKIKLRIIHHVICNSYYTKKYIDQNYQVKSKVIYPPVSFINNFKNVTKRNIIFNVGRFTRGENQDIPGGIKKQKIMLEAFRRLIQRGLNGWKLVFAGSASNDYDYSFLEELKDEARNVPIDFIVNVPFEKLTRLYREAKIYWHAMGYGENEEKNPHLFEHFGISAAEAMICGAVPVVFDGGGLPEIVRHGENGFLWTRAQDLIKQTFILINDEKIRKKFAEAGKETADKFSLERFCAGINKTIKG